ncbi:hypothetical protein EJB05_13020, partial [Eragrostis curvula]
MWARLHSDPRGAHFAPSPSLPSASRFSRSFLLPISLSLTKPYLPPPPEASITRPPRAALAAVGLEDEEAALVSPKTNGDANTAHADELGDGGDDEVTLENKILAIRYRSPHRYHADVPPTALRHLIISLDSGDIDAELGDGDALTAYDEALGLRGSDCLKPWYTLHIKEGEPTFVQGK